MLQQSTQKAWCRDAPTDLQVHALTSVLQLASEDREAIASRFATRLPFLHAFLSHSSSAVRPLAAKLLGVAASGLAPPAAAELVTDLIAKLPLPPSTAVAAVSGLGGKGTVKFEAAHGNILAAGFVCAVVKEGDVVVKCVRALVATLGNGDAHLAAAAAGALGYIQLVIPLPIPPGEAYQRPEGQVPKSAAGARWRAV
jgi:hypothetical protein